MSPTDYTRKLDDLGRVTIPSKLRNRLGINIGDVLPFFVHEDDGQIYLCIKCENAVSDLDKAKMLLAEAGYTFTK